MYLGKIVETGPSRQVYADPWHPYTKGLVDTIPLADPALEAAKARSGVTGELPSALDPPSGCRFRTRCGFEVCRQIRTANRWVPVLMLTARDGVQDKVHGLDAGADDYITKPFDLAELFARVRALTRRDPLERPTQLRVGDLVLDPANRSVRRGGTPIALSAKEFALLQELMRRAGETLTRTYLIEHVWDFAYDGGSNVVDVYVRYLRDKIDRPFDRNTIHTVRGAGYRLDPGT
jgi:two-component system OmpR family response regulator